ncbi:MAG TPA: hypothetical protein VFU46_13745 [Gemmatimonadales bacterium]|nr:hypothetical protein [Gemmatimonadales bacterium]
MRPFHVLLSTLLAAIVAVPAAAQVQAEFAPFVGYRFGGELRDNSGRVFDLDAGVSFGGLVNLDLRRELGVEFLWSHQSSEIALQPLIQPGPFDVNVDQWMVGPWKAFGRPAARLRPVASFLLGISHFSTNVQEGESRDRFALGLGLGAKVFPGRRVGFRIDGRGVFTFTDAETRVFCSSTLNACPLQFEDDLLWQGEVSAAVVVVLGPLRRR